MEVKNNPIRVLHIVSEMGRGGIETMLMNLYRNIDRTQVQFDFLAHYGRRAAYDEEIKSMGGCVYQMPTLRSEEHVYYWKVFEYIIALHAFFKEHQEYQIIHCHMTNTASIYIPIAKKYGVTCCIAHSHNTHGKKGLLGLVTNILQKGIYKKATDWFACSKAAAGWFYPKGAVETGKVTIVPNAVDAKRFRYSPEIRNRMRRELGIDEKMVIGCIARFRPEKNHVFLLRVLKQMLKTESKAILLFAGDGPEEMPVRRMAQELGIADKVLFLGMRSDIPDILQAMDVFILASLWEGLPVTGIEAQAAGLHCVVSDGVTDEMNVINMVKFLSLNEPIETWAKEINLAAKWDRRDTYEKIKSAGYDIHTVASWLQRFYLEKQVNDIKT